MLHVTGVGAVAAVDAWGLVAAIRRHPWQLQRSWCELQEPLTTSLPDQGAASCVSQDHDSRGTS